MAVPPGWYSDPNIPDQLRWWDGNSWTQNLRPAEPVSGGTDQSGRAHVGSQARLRPRILRLGPSTYVAVAVLVLLAIPFAAVGGLLVWFCLAAVVVLLSGLCSLVTGRRSWAHIGGRGPGAIVASVSLACLLATLAAVGATAPVATKSPIAPTSVAEATPAETATPSPSPSTFSTSATPTPTPTLPSAVTTPPPADKPTSQVPTTSTASPTATASAEPTKDPSN